MALNDDDLVTTPGGPGTDGPADSGAGKPADPNEQDGGADGGADEEGPADSGAAEPSTPGEHDGGADGSA
jgi:hypothetical protein